MFDITWKSEIKRKILLEKWYLKLSFDIWNIAHDFVFPFYLFFHSFLDFNDFGTS